MLEKMSMFTSVHRIMAMMVMVFSLYTGTTGVPPETFPLSQAPLLPLLLHSVSGQRHAPDGTEKINDEYDYIIVGGGTAGSVVASRLSEEPCVNVLLLEAGPKPPLISEVPGLNTYLLLSEVDWNFQTVPQKHLDTGLRNKQLVMNTGKMLGGSANLNSMIYFRANPKDYDDWAAQGAEGWSYKDVLPYFLKLEDTRSGLFLNYGYHNVGGPITVEKPCFSSRAKDAFREAIKELGYEFVNPNVKQIGFHDYQQNIRNGQRCSSAKGYLVPAEYRPNLDILLNATATIVITKDKIANGVQFYRNGNFKTVRARKEVIVSGGAVSTPQLLMLSGIGPREELQKLNIPVVVDLPVGRNLQDHGFSNYYFTTDLQFSTRKNIVSNSSILEYVNFRSGPLTNTGSIYGAFLNGLNVTSTSTFPNYQLHIFETQKETEDTTVLEPEIYRQFFGPIDENQRTLYECASQQLHPRSRGTVTLLSPDPFDPPVLDPNYLEHPKDLEDIVEGLKICKKIVNTAAAKSLGARPYETLMPGCEAFANSDDDYLKCFAKRYFGTARHPVGTSKMGNPRDPSTVVDPELRVKGVSGLRVVDASVMPLAPSSGTHIPTMMIAEKASDIIKKSIQCPK